MYFLENLTTISVNVCDCVRMIKSLLLLNRLMYRNMNGIMLSQIVWVMFLPEMFTKSSQKMSKKKSKPHLAMSTLSAQL